MGRVKAFDDAYSFIHFFVSLLISILSPLASIAATICFVEYQRWEKEKWEYKRGDLVEWMVGILIGVLIRTLYGGVCIC